MFYVDLNAVIFVPITTTQSFIHMPQNTILAKLKYRPLLLPLYKYAYIFLNIHLF